MGKNKHFYSDGNEEFLSINIMPKALQFEKYDYKLPITSVLK